MCGCTGIPEILSKIGKGGGSIAKFGTTIRKSKIKYWLYLIYLEKLH
jgi:hypothetical protein